MSDDSQLEPTLFETANENKEWYAVGPKQGIDEPAIEIDGPAVERIDDINEWYNSVKEWYAVGPKQGIDEPAIEIES